MASFTDQLTPFTPYVAQLPIQAMVQVGMEKQAQYNQGVQKIQTQIDNVAGMDIGNETQKKYLQSKLDELGGKLKTVAAGDFSNQQLVNSVGGMATSIVKDPVIQNAVYSTQRAKTELETGEAAYKAGKSSINNINDIRNKVSSYQNNQDVNASFNAKYVNYVDIAKKLQNIADNRKKDAPDNSIENPYKTDESGKTLYFKQDEKTGNITTSTDPSSGGKPVEDNAMKRITIKGVSAQAMYNSFKDSLNADDIEQLKIDAAAQYQGHSGDTLIKKLAEDATDNVQLGKEMIGREINKLNVDLLTSPNLTTSDKLSIQADIKKYQDKLDSGDLDKELNKTLANLQNPANLENIKYQQYTNKLLQGNAVDLSNQSYKQEILANPYAAMNMERAKIQEEIRYHDIQHSDAMNKLVYDYASLRQKELNDIRTREYNERKLKLEHPEQGMVTETRAISTEMTAPTLNSVKDNISSILKDTDKLNNDYGKTLKLTPTVGKDGKVTYSGLDDIYNKYKESGDGAVTNRDALEYVHKRDFFERQAAIQTNIQKKAEEAAQPFEEQLNKSLSNVKGITGANGQSLATGRDLWDVQAAFQRNLSTGSTISVGGSTVNRSPEFNVNNFLKEVGSDPTKQYLAKALIKQTSGQSLTANERVVLNKLTDVKKVADPIVEKIEKDKFDAVAKTVSKYDPFYQEQVGTINPKNERDMAMLGNLIGNAIDNATVSKGLPNLPTDAKFDVDTLAKMRSKSGDAKEDVTANVVKKYDGSAMIIVHQGSATQTIPVTAENFAKYYPDYAKGNPYNEDFHAVLASPDATTNTMGGRGDKSTDALGAAHRGYEIPGLQGSGWENKVRWDIVGDPHHNTGDMDTDRFQVNAYVNYKGTWIPAPQTGGYRSAADIQFYIQNDFGPATIQDILKKSK